jgi:hypothetical protein
MAADVRRWLDTATPTPFSEKIRSSLVSSMAWRDPESLTEWVKTMPPDQKTPEKLQQMATSLINGGSDMDRIEGLLAKAPAELAPALVMAGFSTGSNWPGGDVQPWLARIDQVPEEKRAWASSVLAGRWTATDPDAAIAWAHQLPGGEARSQSFAAIAGRWAKADSYETSEWIRSLPQGQDRDGATGALVKTIARDEPDSALTWAQTITDPQQRTAGITAALEGWARRDPQGALRQLETNSLSPELKESLRQSLTAPGKKPN